VYCGKQYKTRNWLRRHINYRCSRAKKVIKYTCDDCDRKFKSVVAFRKHKISHRIENDTLTKDCDNEVLQDKQNGDDGRKYTENEIQKMSEVDNIEPKKENIEQHNSYEITSPDITTEDAVHKMSESSQNTDKIEVYMDIEETEIDNDHNLKRTCEEDYIVVKNERMDNYQNCEKEIENIKLFTDTSSSTDSSEEGMKRKCQNTDKNDENVRLKKENSYFLDLTNVQDMDEGNCAACEWLETQLAVHKKMHEIARQNRFETYTSLSVELERPVKDGSFCDKTETESHISKRKHFCLEIEKKILRSRVMNVKKKMAY